MLVAATSMAARVAIASGRGLAAVILERYGRAASLTIVLLLAIANVGTIAADAAGVARVLEMMTAAFFIGFVSAGLLALPVLAGSTAYAVAEVFGWREGLGARAAQARGFYVVLSGSLVVGALISLAPGFDPADALFYSQVLDGVLLPFVVLILLVLSNDRTVTG